MNYLRRILRKILPPSPLIELLWPRLEYLARLRGAHCAIDRWEDLPQGKIVMTCGENRIGITVATLECLAENDGFFAIDQIARTMIRRVTAWPSRAVHS